MYELYLTIEKITKRGLSLSSAPPLEDKETNLSLTLRANSLPELIKLADHHLATYRREIQ